MAAKECYHCKQLIEAKDAKTHNCWTTTEEKLTEDLLEAWQRLRETAVDFGEQRIYASHKSIMFSRKACYFFVRPKKDLLEVFFFLGRKVKDPSIRQTHPSSRVKTGHLIHIRHRDEVEAPITDWLREAYHVSEELGAAARKRKAPAKKKISKPKKRPPSPRKRK
jgi:hypothetical protein